MAPRGFGLTVGRRGTGKIVRLRQKLADATNAVKGFFGVQSEKDASVEKMEALRVAPLLCALITMFGL